jgi:hypothetical protein
MTFTISLQIKTINEGNLIIFFLLPSLKHLIVLINFAYLLLHIKIKNFTLFYLNIKITIDCK